MKVSLGHHHSEHILLVSKDSVNYYVQHVLIRRHVNSVTVSTKLGHELLVHIALTAVKLHGHT